MATRAAKSLGIRVPPRSLRAFSAREFDWTCTWAGGPGFYISRLWRCETEFSHRLDSDRIPKLGISDLAVLGPHHVITTPSLQTRHYFLPHRQKRSAWQK